MHCNRICWRLDILRIPNLPVAFDYGFCSGWITYSHTHRYTHTFTHKRMQPNDKTDFGSASHHTQTILLDNIRAISARLAYAIICTHSTDSFPETLAIDLAARRAQPNPSVHSRHKHDSPQSVISAPVRSLAHAIRTCSCCHPLHSPPVPPPSITHRFSPFLPLPPPLFRCAR